MKHFSFIIFALFYVVFLSSCKPQFERTIIKHAHKKDFQSIETHIHNNNKNAYIIGFYVSYINKAPIDTLYKWEEYEQREVKLASWIYSDDIKLINDLKDFTIRADQKFGKQRNKADYDIVSPYLKKQLYDDSIKYVNAKNELARLKTENNEIVALGYEYIEKAVYVIDKKIIIESFHKVIYLSNGGYFIY